MLKNFSDDLFPGEVVALVGPNGIGKTTMLKSISGLEMPLNGDCFFSGKSNPNTLSNSVGMEGAERRIISKT